MSLEDIFKSVKIDWTHAAVNLDSGIALTHSFQVSPSEFLRFAHQDYRAGDKRGLVNAITKLPSCTELVQRVSTP